MAKLTAIIFIFGAIFFFANAQSNNTIQDEKPVNRCGYVYDGPGQVKNLFDLDYQFSTTKISGNWFGFETPINTVKKYEWCIVSQDFLPEDLKIGPAKSRCSSKPGFEGEPDIFQWTDVGTETTASADNLKLEVGKTYFIVLRVHMSLGDIVYTNSDGITVVDDESSQVGILEEPLVSAENDILSVESVETVEEIETVEAVEAVENVQKNEAVEINQTFGQDLSYSERVRKFQNCFRGVGFYLTELYGPPIFVRDPREDPNVAVNLTFESDSESGLTDAQIAGIIVAVVVFVLLLLLLLPALKSSKKANKFQTNPHRTENIENI